MYKMMTFRPLWSLFTVAERRISSEQAKAIWSAFAARGMVDPNAVDDNDGERYSVFWYKQKEPKNQRYYIYI